MTHLNALVKQAHRFLSLLLIPLLLNLTSCALLINGTGQMVPVTSSPVGVEVYLDGEFKGVTPLELQVSRGQTHELLLRFGEEERMISLEPIVGAEAWGAIAVESIPVVGATGLTLTALSDSTCSGNWRQTCLGIGGILIGIGAGISGIFIGVDYATGAIYTLNPTEVNESFENP